MFSCLQRLVCLDTKGKVTKYLKKAANILDPRFQDRQCDNVLHNIEIQKATQFLLKVQTQVSY